MDYKKSLRVLGLTQADLARRLGFSVSSVNQWINGYRPVPSEVETNLQKTIMEAKAEKMQEFAAI